MSEGIRDGLDALGQYHPVEHKKAAAKIMADMSKSDFDKETDALIEKFLGPDPFDGGCPADVSTTPSARTPDICIYFETTGVRWTTASATGVAPDLDLAMRDIQSVLMRGT